jgi:uncharacterized protein (DUF927 family)
MDRIIFQAEKHSPTTKTMHSKGSLADWNGQVLANCVDQPWLLFAISFAFVGPLLKFARMDSFGVHIHKRSSHGKTTLSQVAASVWGCGADPSTSGEKAFIRRYNTTANALQGLAAAHNDLLMVLDEIGTCEDKEFGKLLYDLFGGVTKNRMDRNSNLKDQKSWRIALLSNGEFAAADKIRKCGSLHGGMLVRMLDIPGPENLITGEAPALLVKHLKSVCPEFYGTAGPAFVSKLIARSNGDTGALINTTRAFIDEFLPDYLLLLPASASPEYQRVAERFALIHAAGSMAKQLLEWSITEEQIKQATHAAFNAWLSGSKTLTDNDRGVVHIRNFLIKNEARFKVVPKDERLQVLNIAGYRDNVDGLFLFTEEGFKEACAELPVTTVAQELKNKTLLLTSEKGRLTYRRMIDGDRQRCYAVKKEILSPDDDTACA